MKLMKREPTKEMIEAAYNHYVTPEYTGFSSIFKAMYDAAPMLPEDYEEIEDGNRRL